MKTAAELQDLARDLGVSGFTRLRKKDLIIEILKYETTKENLLFISGILEITNDGYGFFCGYKTIRPARMMCMFPLRKSGVFPCVRGGMKS